MDIEIHTQGKYCMKTGVTLLQTRDPPEAKGRTQNALFLNPFEGHIAQLIFLYQISGHQNWGAINFCCSDSLGLWYFCYSSPRKVVWFTFQFSETFFQKLMCSYLLIFCFLLWYCLSFPPLYTFNVANAIVWFSTFKAS